MEEGSVIEKRKSRKNELAFIVRINVEHTLEIAFCHVFVNLRRVGRRKTIERKQKKEQMNYNTAHEIDDDV